ncbi:MAG: hypothetical protein OXI96_03325 [Acidimicrobiaceae bacterium]|nr:hypothetical protein [Acidimicrobiaceae bacterium]
MMDNPNAPPVSTQVREHYPPGEEEKLNSRTVLSGLPGVNPLGFLAALGTQAALVEQGINCKLHWTNHPIPRPVLSPAVDFQGITRSVHTVSGLWLEGPALDVDPKLKLKPPKIREYLKRCRDAGKSGLLAACLLAEDSLDNNGVAKPSDFYFTAGNQKFVAMARTILGDVSEEEIVNDLSTPWSYNSERESLGWDSTDDRLHAYSADDPSSIKKSSNPGAEALAVIGLSRYPCFASPKGTLTQGCSGSWKEGSFVWPLWDVPATVHSVKSLLAQVAAPTSSKKDRRFKWYAAWGVTQVMQSQIRRSDQGGYGTFGPPRVVWQRD